MERERYILKLYSVCKKTIRFKAFDKETSKTRLSPRYISGFNQGARQLEDGCFKNESKAVFGISLQRLYNRQSALVVLTVFLFLSQQSFLSAQVQVKHIIDYSESGEVLFFKEFGQNSMEIIISPGFESERLYFFITNGTKSQEITFMAKSGDWHFAPAYSYDGENWQIIKNVWEEGGYLYFSFLPIEDSVEVTLNQQSRQPPQLKSATSVTYYTYQRYESFISSISGSPWLIKDTIGQSVQGRDIFLLTITDPSIADSLKKTVWVNFRQHCDEDEISYILEGMAEFLLSADTNSTAREILARTIYKIVPIINVDGVYHKLKRVNANGVDMNRCWSSTTDYSGEEPEIKAVHSAMDNWILDKGNKIYFSIDMHGWGASPDGGYRSNVSMSSSSYVEEQTTFLTQLVQESQWQQINRWLFSAGSKGMARLELYNQHNLNILTSETTTHKRHDGTFATVESFIEQGPAFCRAIDNYLFHIRFTNSDGGDNAGYKPSDKVFIQLEDLDERYSQGIDVTISSQSGDCETVQLTEQNTGGGIFNNSQGIATEICPPIPDDGKLQVQCGDTLKVYYQDNDFPDDNCFAFSVISTSSTVHENLELKPMLLGQNYPNPFKKYTIIPYSLKKTGFISINIYNILGKKVKTLVNKKINIGNYSVSWDGCNDKGQKLPGGTYFYTLRLDDIKQVSRQLIFLE